MRIVRVVLMTVLSSVLLLGLLFGIACIPSVQTWLAKRALSMEPGLDLSIGSLRLRPGSLHVEDLHYRRPGIDLVVPSLDTELSLRDLLRRSYRLKALRSKGWSLHLGGGSGLVPLEGEASGAVVASPGGSLSSALVAKSVTQPGKPLFLGIFRLLELPLDLEVADCQLDGTVIFPAGEGWGDASASVALSGSDLRPSQNASFELATRISFARECPVEEIQIRGHLFARLSDARRFSQVDCALSAQARGTQFPHGASLDFDLALSKQAQSENYRCKILSGGRHALQLDSSWARSSGTLSGTWKLDCSRSDIEPFSVGYPLPDFSARGSGSFSRDLLADAIHLQGDLDGNVGRLEVFSANLAKLGSLRFTSAFDVARRGSELSVERLRCAFIGASPLFSIESAQPFALDVSNSRLQLSNSAAPFLRLDLQGLPSSWLDLLAPGLSASGGPLTGSLFVFAHQTGFSVKTAAIISARGFSLAMGDRPLFSGVDVTISGRVDNTKDGWQCEVSGLDLGQKGLTFLSMQARAGRLARPGSSLVFEGGWKSDLVPLFSQPVFRLAPSLSAGVSSGTIQGSLGGGGEFYAKLLLSKLAPPVGDPHPLPDIELELRASLASDGTLKLDAPALLINREASTSSDLSFSGTIATSSFPVVIDMEAAGRNVVLSDLRPLLGMFSSPVAVSGRESQVHRDRHPAWSACVGRINVSIASLQLEGDSRVADFKVGISIEPLEFGLDSVKGVLPTGGSLEADVFVSFKDQDQPYGLHGSFSVTGLESAVLFGHPRDASWIPPVEGRFDLNGKISGQGLNLVDLFRHSTGKLGILSKGGVCRVLRSDISEYLRQKTRLAGLVSSGLGVLLGSRSADNSPKDRSKLDEYSSMALEVSDYFSNVAYDQLMAVVVRDSAMNIRLEELSLISPQMRLSGQGVIHYAAGRTPLASPMDLGFDLYVRDRMAECLGKAGVLDGKLDSLGYAHLSMPLRLGGTLAAPDATELRNLFRRVVFAKASEELSRKLEEQSK